MKSNTNNIIPTLNDLLQLEYLVASTGFSLLPKQPVHSVLAGKHASKLRGRGLDFEEARKYVAGDDIRNIDWRVTARTRTTYTKVFTEEKEKPVLIITDLTPSMFFGSKVYTKSYIASQLAAISAFKVLKNSDRVGGIIFNHKQTVTHAPKRNRKNILQYFNTMVSFNKELLNENNNIEDKTEVFEKVLNKTISIATHDFLVIIISDFINTSAKTKKQIIHISQHNDVILCPISDPMESDLGSDKLVLSDGNLQFLWKENNQKQTANFKRQQNEYNQNFQKEISRYGIPFMQLNTVEPINLQLKNLFKNKLQKNR